MGILLFRGLLFCFVLCLLYGEASLAQSGGGEATRQESDLELILKATILF